MIRIVQPEMPSRISSSLLSSTSPKNAINISAYNLEILLLKWRGHRAGCTFLNFLCIRSVSSHFCLCVCLYATLCFVLHKILDFIFLKNMKLHTLIFYLFIFITMCIFSACISLYHMCGWYWLYQRSALYTLELKLQIVENPHMSAGNWTQNFWKNINCY